LCDTLYQYRVEGIAPALFHARDEVTLAAIAKDKQWEEKTETEEHLQLMYSELEDLAPFDVFDDAAHKAEYQQQRAVVKVAEEAVDEAESAHESAVAAVRKAAAKVSRLEGQKSHGRA
jgi:tRNA U55 pseudouridine synthase TruB